MIKLELFCGFSILLVWRWLWISYSMTEIVFYLTLLIDASFLSADSLPVLDVEETAGKFNTLGTYSI